jgi:hypothetical protein
MIMIESKQLYLFSSREICINVPEKYEQLTEGTFDCLKMLLIIVNRSFCLLWRILINASHEDAALVTSPYCKRENIELL